MNHTNTHSLLSQPPSIYLITRRFDLEEAVSVRDLGLGGVASEAFLLGDPVDARLVDGVDEDLFEAKDGAGDAPFARCGEEEGGNVAEAVLGGAPDGLGVDRLVGGLEDGSSSLQAICFGRMTIVNEEWVILG